MEERKINRCLFLGVFLDNFLHVGRFEILLHRIYMNSLNFFTLTIWLKLEEYLKYINYLTNKKIKISYAIFIDALFTNFKHYIYYRPVGRFIFCFFANFLSSIFYRWKDTLLCEKISIKGANRDCVFLVILNPHGFEYPLLYTHKCSGHGM